MAMADRHIDELAKQLEFQAVKLRECRTEMESMPTIMAYDNGGGQKGIRKNPAYDAYNALMQNFRKSLQLLVELSGPDAPKDEDSPLARILAEAEEIVANA